MVQILSFTHFNKKAQTNHNSQVKSEEVFICLTLRQWSLLFSFLIFICTALFTVCTVLGTMHIREVWSLLERDIKEEHEKNEYAFEGFVRQMSPNEVKLRASETFMINMHVAAVSKFLSICMWSGLFNLLLVGVMIYGIATRRHSYILPWLLSSIITFLMTLAFTVLAYTGFVRYICFDEYVILWIIPVVLIYLYMWRIICKYYITVNPSLAKLKVNSPKTVRSMGMYTHTIQPNLTNNVKPMV